LRPAAAGAARFSAIPQVAHRYNAQKAKEAAGPRFPHRTPDRRHPKEFRPGAVSDAGERAW